MIIQRPNFYFIEAFFFVCFFPTGSWASLIKFIVIFFQFKSISSRSSGITVISFVFFIGFLWESTIPSLSAHAETMCIPFFRVFGKNAFKLLWIDVCKYPQNCICTGDSVFQFEKFSQSVNLIFCPKDYVFYICMTAYKADDA